MKIKYNETDAPMNDEELDGTIQTNLNRHMVPMNIGYTLPMNTLNQDDAKKGKTIKFVRNKVSDKKSRYLLSNKNTLLCTFPENYGGEADDDEGDFSG